MFVMVAPFAGAWIETPLGLFPESLIRSLLSQERGLKHDNLAKFTEDYVSLLSQERGLKQVLRSPAAL